MSDGLLLFLGLWVLCLVFVAGDIVARWLGFRD